MMAESSRGVILKFAGGERGNRVGALIRQTTITGLPHCGYLHRPGVSGG